MNSKCIARNDFYIYRDVYFRRCAAVVSFITAPPTYHSFSTEQSLEQHCHLPPLLRSPPPSLLSTCSRYLRQAVSPLHHQHRQRAAIEFLGKLEMKNVTEMSVRCEQEHLDLGI